MRELYLKRGVSLDRSFHRDLANDYKDNAEAGVIGVL